MLGPLGRTSDAVKPLAPSAEPDGLRIGVLDSSTPNADVLLASVAEALAARAGGATISRWTKPGSSRP